MDFQIPFTLYLQTYKEKKEALYYALRDTVEQGGLPNGAKLPATRELARMYGLSRGTVNPVYETLAAEGYIRSETGRGTFVSFESGRSQPKSSMPSAGITLSPWGYRVAERFDEPPHTQPALPRSIAFALGAAVDGSFPHAEWSRCLHEAIRRLSECGRDAASEPAQGSLELREAIAAYLRRARGIAVDAAQVAVVGGSMQAIALLAQLTVSPGDAVVVESPGYAATARAAEAAGGRALLAPVDASGIVPQPWDARLLFVTPNRQFPTGVTLPLERRQALLRWAAERGAVIVEDDYDGEFRHRGRPLEPLKRLDTDGRVAYIGSFSRTMPPDVRIGYAVLPAALSAPFAAAMRLYEPQPVGLLQQRALAAFMRSGLYERHLRRMKRQYSRSYEMFSRLAHERLSHLFAWTDSNAGMSLFGWWRRSVEEYKAFRSLCREAGVEWTDADRYLPQEGRIGCCFGFGRLEEKDLREGVDRIARVCEQYFGQGGVVGG